MPTTARIATFPVELTLLAFALLTALATESVNVRFLVNGDVAAELLRSAVDPDGIVGFRIDAGLNTHITTLDITDGAGTRHWAPAAPE